MTQGTLFVSSLVVTGACAFGPGDPTWPGPHHCEHCASAVEEARRQFRTAVARGEFDARGYTPSERRMQARRAAP